MPEPLRVEGLIEDARKQTGLSDFGGGSWRPALEILVDSANREAKLNELGRASLATHAVALLANRLQIADCIRRNPEIERQRIERPLFIVGLGRTGSTRLQYLLAQDPAVRSLRRFESMRSVPMAGAKGGIDPRLEITAREDEAAGLLVPEFKSIHHEPVDGPTECVMLFRGEFASFCLESQWALPSWGDWYVGCDMAGAYAYHQRVLQLLQWQQAGRWVLKSPVHSWALDALVARYPDARFVMTHRDPSEVIVSVADIYSEVGSMFSERIDLHYLGALNLEHWSVGMRRACAFRAAGNDARFYDMDFRAVQRDPIGQVRGLYAWLGEPVSSEFEAGMTRWWKENAENRAPNVHPEPARFGLDLERVRPLFADYVERMKRWTAH